MKLYRIRLDLREDTDTWVKQVKGKIYYLDSKRERKPCWKETDPDYLDDHGDLYEKASAAEFTLITGKTP